MLRGTVGAGTSRGGVAARGAVGGASPQPEDPSIKARTAMVFRCKSVIRGSLLPLTCESSISDIHCRSRARLQTEHFSDNIRGTSSMAEERNPSDGRPGELDSTLNLLERARLGDRQAIEQLFARHLKPLQRWAGGRLPKWARDLTDTDDLVQDTLLRTFRRIGEFEPRGVGALQAYLRQAVLNRIREELRRKGRRPDATDLDDVAVDSAESPLEHAIGIEAVDRYERALSRLKAHERE